MRYFVSLGPRGLHFFSRAPPTASMETPAIHQPETLHESKTSQRFQPRRNPNPSKSTPATPSRSLGSGSYSLAFSFWARLCFLVSLFTLLIASLYSLRPKDERSRFLVFPDDLRSHYSQGRMIKAQIAPEEPPVEIFTIESGPKSGETVLLLHGLGCNSYSFRDVLPYLGAYGLRAIAVDIPGAGFSDSPINRGDLKRAGALGWIWEIYSDIKEKGIFWGFDQLIETGHIPYEDQKTSVSEEKSTEGVFLNAHMASRIILQVITSLDLAPVHLVLHDSALEIGKLLAMENPGFVSGVTIMDSSPQSAAFPSWIIGTPLLRELFLRSNFLFSGLLKLCCSRSMNAAAAEAHLLLLKNNQGSKAVVESGRVLNFSLSIEDLASYLAATPTLILWSGSWSDRWIDEGRRVAAALPKAKFIYHSGGRWPQVNRLISPSLCLFPAVEGMGNLGS